MSVCGINYDNDLEHAQFMREQYLGFKNARFGKIDIHISTCAFSREVLADSMWLRKPNASDEEYKRLCEKIEGELGLPISYEGRYRWIVLNLILVVVLSAAINSRTRTIYFHLEKINR